MKSMILAFTPIVVIIWLAFAFIEVDKLQWWSIPTGVTVFVCCLIWAAYCGSNI